MFAMSRRHFPWVYGAASTTNCVSAGTVICALLCETLQALWIFSRDEGRQQNPIHRFYVNTKPSLSTSIMHLTASVLNSPFMRLEPLWFKWVQDLLFPTLVTGGLTLRLRKSGFPCTLLHSKMCGQDSPKIPCPWEAPGDAWDNVILRPPSVFIRILN